MLSLGFNARGLLVLERSDLFSIRRGPCSPGHARALWNQEAPALRPSSGPGLWPDVPSFTNVFLLLNEDGGSFQGQHVSRCRTIGPSVFELLPGEEEDYCGGDLFWMSEFIAHVSAAFLKFFIWNYKYSFFTETFFFKLSSKVFFFFIFQELVSST